MANWAKTFLKRLEQELAPYREDCIFLEEEGSNPDTLRQLFDVGQEQAAPVIVDMAVFTMDDGRELLQIFTGIIPEIREEVIPGLLECANRLNMLAPIGAFGYFSQERQLYHKYNLLVEKPEDMEIFLQKIIEILEAILNIVGNCYKELDEAAKGEH